MRAITTVATVAFAAAIGLAAALAAPAPARAIGGPFQVSPAGNDLVIKAGGKHRGRHGHRHRRHGNNFARFISPFPYYSYYAPPVYSYSYYSAPRRGYGRCDSWARACASNWGWNNADWRGCMRYYGCY